MSIASSLARIGLAVLALAGCAVAGSASRRPEDLPAARGTVGPPLVGFSRRIYIAGHVPNTPENLVRWISDPQALEPGTAMPDVELSERPARDAAAYLLSLD